LDLPSLAVFFLECKIGACSDVGGLMIVCWSVPSAEKKSDNNWQSVLMFLAHGCQAWNESRIFGTSLDRFLHHNSLVSKQISCYEQVWAFCLQAHQRVLAVAFGYIPAVVSDWQVLSTELSWVSVQKNATSVSFIVIKKLIEFYGLVPGGALTLFVIMILYNDSVE
jgi:hypothetical protein